MTKPTETAQEWLELCQQGINQNLPLNQIPFFPFLKALKECLPCQIQIGDNPPITVVLVGSIHPLNHSLSYRGDRESDVDGSVMGSGISLKSARIVS
jgi:hypothetical protein